MAVLFLLLPKMIAALYHFVFFVIKKPGKDVPHQFKDLLVDLFSW